MEKSNAKQIAKLSDSKLLEIAERVEREIELRGEDIGDQIIECYSKYLFDIDTIDYNCGDLKDKLVDLLEDYPFDTTQVNQIESKIKKMSDEDLMEVLESHGDVSEYSNYWVGDALSWINPSMEEELSYLIEGAGFDPDLIDEDKLIRVARENGIHLDSYVDLNYEECGIALYADTEFFKAILELTPRSKLSLVRGGKTSFFNEVKPSNAKLSIVRG